MNGPVIVPDRWRRIEELFHVSSEMPEPQRRAFLREACGNDEQLRRELETLLAIDDHESLLIAGIVDDATNSLLLDEEPGATAAEPDRAKGAAPLSAPVSTPDSDGAGPQSGGVHKDA